MSSRLYEPTDLSPVDLPEDTLVSFDTGDGPRLGLSRGAAPDGSYRVATVILGPHASVDSVVVPARPKVSPVAPSKSYWVRLLLILNLVLVIYTFGHSKVHGATTYEDSDGNTRQYSNVALIWHSTCAAAFYPLYWSTWLNRRL